MKTGNSKCFKCNRIKRKVLFHIDKSRKAGVSSYCKSCKSKLDRLRSSRRGERNEKGDHIYTVYYLPEEHYAGMTKDLLRRISSHKKLGKIVDGYEIVGQFENPKVAHLMETKLHIMGYNGFQYSG
tara:strand:- start:489 stop:866 length:378 start_codon:yes stop_codon:yes gene_type:complete